MNTFDIVEAIHQLYREPHIARLANRSDLSRVESFIPSGWRLKILEETKEGIVVTYKENGRQPRPHV